MIKIKGIEKKYIKKIVLKDINFEMNEGSCVGILGGNGSGKTTLLSVLAGILKPDAGQFIYMGRDLLRDKIFRRSTVGLIPQTNPLIEELSAWDNLILWYDKNELLKALKSGVPAMLGIDEFLNVRVSRMSGGMKKRLSIACAVASSPRVLLMDEPSAALDLVCKEHIHNYINAFKKAGGSIILVTHDEGDLKLCTRHYILKNGILEAYIYDGDVHKLVDRIR
ncbi:hypothetical protein HMPREF9333_01482 [Johnsonella ignava ATCC 51276]|uniref:ABC transporter domain-containing protein n=1 Tax=Johnsonella ignava ATCC 51276 TaxID=679200 RepID=G5GIU2_9FIRM|nr:ATP-binding cassette domain-containing protein [Johnsonella ignava]EHI55346.1 hypothetical protein HMPREF9333_01482 [Johnsonella ignava ATCC 51276]